MDTLHVVLGLPVLLSAWMRVRTPDTFMPKGVGDVLAGVEQCIVQPSSWTTYPHQYDCAGWHLIAHSMAVSRTMDTVWPNLGHQAESSIIDTASLHLLIHFTAVSKAVEPRWARRCFRALRTSAGPGSFGGPVHRHRAGGALSPGQGEASGLPQFSASLRLIWNKHMSPSIARQNHHHQPLPAAAGSDATARGGDTST